MGKIKKPLSVKLVSGFIFHNHDCFLKAKNVLKKKFGEIDFESPLLPFTHTDYYQKEFGSDLTRSFLSFRRLIKPENLPEIKIYTNKIEARLSKAGKRQINIDPGYLTLAKLVLATTKDYKHRIYLNQGIWAEVTLFYQNGTFAAWSWTYPDYQTETYLQIFNQIRKIYARQI